MRFLIGKRRGPAANFLWQREGLPSGPWKAKIWSWTSPVDLVIVEPDILQTSTAFVEVMSSAVAARKEVENCILDVVMGLLYRMNYAFLVFRVVRKIDGEECEGVMLMLPTDEALRASYIEFPTTFLDRADTILRKHDEPSRRMRIERFPPSLQSQSINYPEIVSVSHTYLTHDIENTNREAVKGCVIKLMQL